MSTESLYYEDVDNPNRNPILMDTMNPSNRTSSACGGFNPKFKDFSNPDNLKKNFDDLLSEMGASQNCKTAANTVFKQVKNEFRDRGGSGRGGGCVLFTCGRGFTTPVEFASFSERVESKFDASTGCPMMLANLADMSRSSQIMKCNISRNTKKSTYMAKSGAWLEINSKGVQEPAYEALQSVETIANGLVALLDRIKNETSMTTEERIFIENIIENKATTMQAIIDGLIARVVITGSRIISKADIHVNISEGFEVTQEVTKSFKNLTKKLTQNEILHDSDRSDLSPTMTAAIDTKVEEHIQASSTSLHETVHNNTVTVASTGNVIIEAYGDIIIKDSEITAEAEVDLKLSSIVGLSKKYAREVAQSIFSKALDDHMNKKRSVFTSIFNLNLGSTAPAPAVHQIENDKMIYIVPLISVAVILILILVLLALKK